MAIAIHSTIVANEAIGGTIAAPVLRLTLFGQMQAEDEAGTNVLPRARKTRAVLAVLALEAPKPVLRSRLTGLLWSQRAREQARGSLRQSVHELQQALGRPASSLLNSDRNHLAVSDDGLWVDVRVLIEASVASPHVLRFFRPTLLDDLAGLDPMFDAWLAEQRQGVIRRALTIAEALLSTASGTVDRIAAAEQLLTIDRTHDGGWDALIRANLEQGNRLAARLTFERYSEALSRMGLAPSGEITALLRSSRIAQPPASKSWDPAKEVRLRLLSPRALDDAALGGALPGLVEEITAAVSRFRWITCVTEAPGSALTEAAWHEPDADYILDSTLQQSGIHIRIIVRLLDPSAGNSVVWAQRFDRETCDALSLQSEVAAETAAQIDPELLLREGDRRTANELADATAFDLTLRAIPPIYRLEPSGFHAAGELLATAAALEPGNAAVHAWWAYWHMILVGQAWATDPLAATLRGGELAERAVILDPGDARALTLVGHVRGFLHKRPEEACALHERALSLNPNLPLAWCFSGLAHCYLGRHDTAIEHISRAQQLSPHDPHAFFFDMALMMPYFLRGDFDRALAVGRRAIELNPGFTSTYKGYLATLGRLGNEQESARVLARLLAIEPGFCVRSALERSPMTIAADLRLYAEGLRRAGLPES